MLVVGEDVCELCAGVIGSGEEAVTVSRAASLDAEGRPRYQWQHTACQRQANEASAEAWAANAEAPPPPWAEWQRALTDPATTARRLWELEQRLAALEAER